ncbi:ABC-type transport system substrate-binding protein [Anaerosolibacter carboniphilus]|uniref:ABC-type transport system substrate-binding protein n=1 Tax=Anaerosolibacter carboniphilus TaxID=1417629 RepID=A0A841KTF2_9FIRM|nr:ABC transporter substrate-binding protein [Anaerosolibacter carboniphilus]MBB6214202.1 ABC-type transport system substrate-binding protein [Anaerosolibacter carboniphilus]
MNYCINKEELIQLATNGLATAAKGPLPPSILHDPHLTGYSYNVSKAKSLLEQAGFKGNQKGTLNLVFMEMIGDQTYPLIAKATQKYLKEIGIETKITSRPRTEYLTPEVYNTVDIFVYRWIGDTGDPDNFLQPMFNIKNATDFTRYHSPEVESLMESAISIKNPIKRQEQYYEIQQKIVEDAPWIFLFHNTNDYVFKPHVKGVKIHPLGFYKLNNMWIDE